MAYREPTVVIFYYDIEQFFNLASVESMYRSELDMDQKGMTNMDYRALTNNDQQFFSILLKRAASECYHVLQALSKGSAEGFLYNALPVRTVEQLNDLVSPEENLYFEMSDGGILDLGKVTVAKGDKVSFNGTIWVKNNAATVKYILYTLSLPWNFDLNNQFGLDDKIREFITVFVVYQWFKRQKYDLGYIEPEYTTVRTELGRIINYRTIIRRDYRSY